MKSKINKTYKNIVQIQLLKQNKNIVKYLGGTDKHNVY